MSDFINPYETPNTSSLQSSPSIRNRVDETISNGQARNVTATPQNSNKHSIEVELSDVDDVEPVVIKKVKGRPRLNGVPGKKLGTLFHLTLRPTKNPKLKRNELYAVLLPYAEELVVAWEPGQTDKRTPYHLHAYIRTKEPCYDKDWLGIKL